MKQLGKKVFVLLLVLVTLCAGSAMADSLNASYADNPPTEVLQHVQANYGGYTLEDYIAINGTSKGDYGFALLNSGNSRILVGYHKVDGKMAYWMKNTDAVPQKDGYVCFERHGAGMYISYGNTNATYSNSLGFNVLRVDKTAMNNIAQSVSYHWENGTFQLFAYMDRSAGTQQAYVTDSGVSFYNLSTGKRIGRVKGTLQRNISYISYKAMPKTYAKAENKLTVAPEIPVGEMSAVNVKFTGGKKYAVYSAPSTESLRANNSKATVSTNDWIQVFGEEDGYILIQYAINKNQMRFGYISAASLPKKTTVQDLTWSYMETYLGQDATLTDDPLNSQSSLMALPAGTRLTLLSTMGTWAYVETTDGVWARGFVPQSVLTYGVTYDLSDYADGKASGTMSVSDDNQMTLTMTVQEDSNAAYYLVVDESGNQLGVATKQEDGTYQMQGSVPESTAGVSFIPVSGNGTQGEALFSVEW